MEQRTQNRRHSSQSLTFLCLVISTLLATADLQSQEVTPLNIAASGNDLKKVSLLLEKGAELEARDIDGWTPLMVAAGKSSTPEIVQLLLEKGAELNARSTAGGTPLMFAARNSSTPEIVQLLLEKGADALAKDKEGKKAIDHAQKNEKLKGTPAYWKLHNKSFE